MWWQNGIFWFGLDLSCGCSTQVLFLSDAPDRVALVLLVVFRSHLRPVTKMNSASTAIDGPFRYNQLAIMLVRDTRGDYECPD